MRWACKMLVCVLFVSSTSDIVFNKNAGAITNYSQFAKDVYFKSRPDVYDHNRNQYSFRLAE